MQTTDVPRHCVRIDGGDNLCTILLDRSRQTALTMHTSE
jgi:hypothetical protein